MNRLFLFLARLHAGRIVLHLLCVFHNHRWAWHLAGVLREIFGKGKI
jgi:hypothetical protein